MKPTVLVIDDDETGSYLLRFVLERLGCEVVTAPDGDRGLGLASELLPALILLDSNLPGLSGLAVAQALQARPETRGIPVIVLTAAPSAALAAEFRGFGSVDFIERPIELDDFIERLRQQLEIGTSP